MFKLREVFMPIEPRLPPITSNSWGTTNTLSIVEDTDNQKIKIIESSKGIFRKLLAYCFTKNFVENHSVFFEGRTEYEFQTLTDLRGKNLSDKEWSKLSKLLENVPKTYSQDQQAEFFQTLNTIRRTQDVSNQRFCIVRTALTKEPFKTIMNEKFRDFFGVEDSGMYTIRDLDLARIRDHFKENNSLEETLLSCYQDPLIGKSRARAMLKGFMLLVFKNVPDRFKNDGVVPAAGVMANVVKSLSDVMSAYNDYIKKETARYRNEAIALKEGGIEPFEWQLGDHASQKTPIDFNTKSALDFFNALDNYKRS